MIKRFVQGSYLLLLAVAVGCSSASVKTETPARQAVEIPSFSADSAYAYVAAQVDFGPRVPASSGHERCRQWLAGELGRHGADTVILQQSIVTTHDGKRLPICNIMGRFGLNKASRILLLAHYDTRPWADAEPDNALHMTPIPGANDGASGVGVLLEVARQIGAASPAVGVDILFVDAEDSGADDITDSWALGTQYWAANMPYEVGRVPRYGVLLDMVGAADAVFTREYLSTALAGAVVDKVWAAAKESGNGARFASRVEGAVTDDHIYVNRAGIPCVDIIECANPVTGSFHPSWHTLSDNMEIIDRATLQAVGETVLHLLYTEPK